MKRFLILALALAGCTDGLSPAGLRATASVNPGDVSVGQPVTITVTVTNTSLSTAKVHLDGCPPPFTVTDASGAKVGPYQMVCALMLVAPREIPPGASASTEFVWNGRAWTENPQADPPFVGPGTYSVIPEVSSNAGMITRVESATLVIR